MKVPQIRMESQFAQIQIKQTAAKVHINQEQPSVKMKQRPAELSIRTTPSKLSIDQTEAWEDMNLMSISKRNEQFAAAGMRAVQEGMARTASEGNELMAIENGGNPFTAQAKRISNPPPKELGIKFIPSSFSVKTDYQPAEVHIDVTTNEPDIQVNTQPPSFTYEPGTIDTSLLQRNYLDISYVNL